MPTPQHCPSPRELDDLELLLNGALAPLTAFNQDGSVVTLRLPDELRSEPVVELVDPEGLPLARFDVATGQVEALTHPQYGPFRRLYLSPAQAREAYAGRTVVPVTAALTAGQVASVRPLGPVVLLALCGTGREGLSTVGLVRATLAAAALVGDAEVVAVPLAAHGDDAADAALADTVIGHYAGNDPVHRSLGGDGDLPASVAAVVAQDQPAADQQGLVLFFTGLSGSGKSTLARALMDRILEQGRRTVTSLDGDVVRRHLSAGLTFSKADRETNIRRIGWVAAEISRHGGLAVCSPIAPFAETRRQVREMVEQAGGAFFLVHVATPLEECERRDRKGLYAKARAGEIPEFTGISSPYEEPDDAAVRVDTSGRTIEDALGDVVDALAATGRLDLREQDADTEPIKVLFVCTANICRSPYMEIVARHLAGPGSELEFTSAGIHGLDAQPMNPEMAVGLDDQGIPYAEHRSRRLTRALVDEADLVLAAETLHRDFILEEQPEAFRKVFTLGQVARAIGQLDDGLTGRELVERIGQRRPTASPDDDVLDPYQRGAAANQATRDQIERLLPQVVNRLRGPEPPRRLCLG